MAKKKTSSKAKAKSEDKEERKDEDQSKDESEDDVLVNPSNKNQLRNTILFIVIVGLIAAIFIVPMLFPEYNFIVLKPKPVESDYSPYEYNSFFFSYRDGIWFTEAQAGNTIYELGFRYGPKELEDVKVLGEIERIKQAKYFYITFDMEDGDKYTTLANAEVAIKIANHFPNEIREACAGEHPDCEGVPIKNCDNTNEPVIYLKVDEGPVVEQDGNCIVIQGEGEDLVKAADRFMYMMYGIM